jgi:hypothetical protein
MYVSAIDSITALLPIVALVVVGGIAVTYLTDFVGGRRVGRELFPLGIVLVMTAIVMMIGGSVLSTSISSLANIATTGVADATSEAPQPPDLSSLEKDICDLDFKIRSAPNIYSDKEMLSEKLAELRSAQAVKIGEYNAKVDDWNVKTNGCVPSTDASGQYVETVCWQAYRLNHFGGCD